LYSVIKLVAFDSITIIIIIIISSSSRAAVVLYTPNVAAFLPAFRLIVRAPSQLWG
jgi:hypothetical protein